MRLTLHQHHQAFLHLLLQHQGTKVTSMTITLRRHHRQGQGRRLLLHLTDHTTEMNLAALLASEPAWPHSVAAGCSEHVALRPFSSGQYMLLQPVSSPSHLF